MLKYFALLIVLLPALSSGVHLAVKNDSGPYCIVMDADISGVVNYYDVSKKATVSYEFVVDDIDYAGKCHSADMEKKSGAESVDIDFLPKNLTTFLPAEERWSIHLKFEVDDSQSESFRIADYKLKALFYDHTFNVSHPKTPAIYERAKDGELEWSAIDKNAFSCSKSVLKLTKDSTLQFSSLKLIAFAMLEKDTFPASQFFELCKLDIRTSDVIPIIVGVCLAILVVAVLAAYLIGRYRAKRRGYESV